MTTTRRCPTNHRNLDADGYRVEKDHTGRQVWLLYTCRDCGIRLEQPYEMRQRGPIRPVRGGLAQDREAS